MAALRQSPSPKLPPPSSETAPAKSWNRPPMTKPAANRSKPVAAGQLMVWAKPTSRPYTPLPLPCSTNRPLEAGLPPGFETTDAIAAELRFDAAWNDWLGRQLEGDTGIADPLSIALSSGMTVAHLRAIAMAFHQNYSDLRGVEFEDLPCPQATSRELLASALPEMERLSRFSKLGSEDLLYRHVQDKLNAICGLECLDPGSSISFMLLNRLLPLKQSEAGKEIGSTIPPAAETPCAALKDLLSELDEQVSHELRTARQVALISILSELQEFVLDYAGTRREIDGRAEFHDLLVWTHELLRDNIEVRDHFRRRFTHLLIDESQDTDPIQAK